MILFPPTNKKFIQKQGINLNCFIIYTPIWSYTSVHLAPIQCNLWLSMTHHEASFILSFAKCKGIKKQEIHVYCTIQAFKTLIFVQPTTYFYVSGRVPCLTDTVLRWSWWLKRSLWIIAFKGLAWPAGWDQDLSLQPHRNTSELWPLPPIIHHRLEAVQSQDCESITGLSRKPTTFFCNKRNHNFLWSSEIQTG